MAVTKTLRTNERTNGLNVGLFAQVVVLTATHGDVENKGTAEMNEEGGRVGVGAMKVLDNVVVGCS